MTAPSPAPTPSTAGPASPLAAPPPARPSALLPVLIGLLAASILVLAAALFFPQAAGSQGNVTVKPTPSMLTAVRDLARLETTEVHVEKVIDLTDRQSRL